MKINPVTLAFGAPIEQRPATAVIEVALALDRVNENRALPMQEHRRSEIQSGYWLGFLAMKSGHGSDASMDFIVLALNMGLVLCEMGYEPDDIGTIERAQQAAVRTINRGMKAGRWGFDGDAMNAICDALVVHDAQLVKARQADILGAMEVIKYRQHNGVAYALEPA